MTGTQPDSRKANGTGGHHLRWMQTIIFGIVCALIIGIFLLSAEPGFHDVASPRAEDCYYNSLVRGFREGQLNVKRDAPPGLALLTNPYDPAQNKPYLWESGHVCHDMSYYHGKLYLYFGVAPALTLFWPYVILTGHYLPDKDAVVFFLALAFVITTGLLHALWRRYFPKASVWVIVFCMIVMGLATGALELLSSCDVYETAISCGLAYAMLALAGVWKALHEPTQKKRWLLVASLAYGMAVASRPSLLFGAIILLAPAIQAWLHANEPGSRWRAGLLLAPTVIPITFIGLGLMLYNALRFGNPFEFGWHYALTDIQDTTARQLSTDYVWFNFRFYFIGQMHWVRHFPFLETIPLLPTPPGYGATERPYSGILTDYPIAWLALAAPLTLRGRAGKGDSPLCWFMTVLFLLFLAGATTICLFLIASSRYEMDFLPALMFLAVIGILGLDQVVTGSITRCFVRGTWCLLLVYSVLFNALASVKAHAMENWLDGNVFLNESQVDKAIICLKTATTLDPQSASFHFALANALSRAGQADESVFEYKKALEIKPDYAEADNNLAFTLLQNQQVAEAITYFQQAVKVEPSYEAYYNLGYAYRLNGMAKEAMDSYRQSLELQPAFLPAQISLAWILATWPDTSVRDGNEAVALAEKANAFANGADPKILRTLAAAYAETGRFPEAMATAKQALALVSAQSNLGNELQAEIQLYQKNSPVRTTGN